MKNLVGTKTVKNLMKSFAGECQAKKEHAKRFYKFLKDDFIDEAIKISTKYPVSFHQEMVKNLGYIRLLRDNYSKKIAIL